MPDGHLLGDVDRLLEPALIRQLTASCYVEGKGRPSIDPVVYFRMVLVAYLLLGAFAICAAYALLHNVIFGLP